MVHMPLCSMASSRQSAQENSWHAQAVQVGKFWSMAGFHAFVVLFISSMVTALYAHVTCHTIIRPDDYLIRAEAKYISVLLSAFFLLGRPACMCLCQPYIRVQCAAP